MLHFMRRFATSWGGKILGMALIVALAAFGVPSILATLDANTLTRVGDEDITAVDFQRLYQQNLNAFAQQTGQLPTNEQAIQMGIPTSVLNQLTTRAAINQFAIRNGIGVSDTKLAELVRDDQTFFGVLGAFDRSIYDQYLRQQGMTSEQYFEVQRKAARRQQIAIGLFAGSQISKTGLDLLNRYRNDLRTIEYFTLNSTSLPDDPDADRAGSRDLPHRAPGRVPHAGNPHRRRSGAEPREPRDAARLPADRGRGPRRVRAHQGVS